LKAQVWFISAGLSIAFWLLLMFGTWQGEAGYQYTGFTLLSNRFIPLFIFDFSELLFLGWLVVWSRVLTFVLWTFAALSIFLGLKRVLAKR
jgi:hypothetical protein